MDRALALVRHHAGAAAFQVAQVALLGNIYRYGARLAGLAVIGRQRRGLAQGRGRHWTTAGLDDDMGPRNSARVQPEIACPRLVKCDFLILPAVLTYQQDKVVGGLPPQWCATFGYALGRRLYLACFAP